MIAQMQSEAMRSPIRADNGTEFQISTPVGRHASLRDTGQRIEPMLDLPLYAQEPSPVQGGVQPLGSPPRAGKEVVDHKGSKKSSKSQKPHVDSVISQMKLLIDGLENKTPKAPTEGPGQTNHPDRLRQRVRKRVVVQEGQVMDPQNLVGHPSRQHRRPKVRLTCTRKKRKP